jgi:hypothetical protein
LRQLIPMPKKITVTILQIINPKIIIPFFNLSPSFVPQI